MSATPRALRSAVKRGDANKVAALLAAGADCHNVDPAGRSALTWAATQGKQPVVVVLLNGGARVDGLDNEGWTALMYSAYRGHAGVVKHLLEARADPMPRALSGDWEGRRALDIAKGRRHSECITLLHAATCGGPGEPLEPLDPGPEPEPEAELNLELELETVSLQPNVPTPDPLGLLGVASAILESQRVAWEDWWEPEVERDERWSPGVPGSISWREIRNLPAIAASELAPSAGGTLQPQREVVCDGVVSICSICFEPVHDGVEILTIPCTHRHHAECLTDWLRRKNECPDCRGNVFTQNAWSQWLSSPPPPRTRC